MYNTAHFSRMPKTELPGTRMKKPQIVAGTSLHGEIIPLFCNLVMPGTVDSNKAFGQIWMSTPIAPIMSQIKCSLHTFFVPLRLVWKHTKEFFGENKTTSGPQTTTYYIPRKAINKSSDATSKVMVGSVSHYLGKPLYKGSTLDSGSVDNLVSVLKERAYWLTVSEFYRAQQVENPFILIDDDTGGIGSISGVYKDFSSMPEVCLKDFDYFTTCTISPNYGGEVLLPLGSAAPVFAAATDHTYPQTNPVRMKDTSGVNVFSGPLGFAYGGALKADSNSGFNSGNHDIVFSNLYADLSKATASKIDDLYTAMAAQAWYHNANYGSRYFEVMEIHYGVSNPDLVLDRPEHVSEFTFDIIVQDVISAAGATNDASTKLGQPGAYAKTLVRKKLYNHSFGEWGFVICLMNTYHQRYYSAGVPREDLYSELFDFYFPEFACRGDDYTMFNELFCCSSMDGSTAFGYQEAYADRRYYVSRATAQLDPYCSAADNGKNALGRFVLDEKWTSRPSLGAQFLKEDRNAIKDALVSGSNGPDYVWQFNFEHIEILPMPAYSKPGIPSFGRGIV